MKATKLNGQITADRRLIIERVPKDLLPGSVEVRASGNEEETPQAAR